MENPLTKKLRGMIRILRERNEKLNSKLEELEHLIDINATCNNRAKDSIESKGFDSAIKKLQKSLETSKKEATSYKERLTSTQIRYRDMREKVLKERQRVKETRQERNDSRKLADEREAAQLFFEDILKGKTEQEAQLNFIRKGSVTSGRLIARSFCHWLYSQPERKIFGAVALGTYLVGDELFEASLLYFKEAGLDYSWKLAPIELMTSMLGSPENNYLQESFNWAKQQVDLNNFSFALSSIKVFVKFGHYAQARKICERLIKATNKADLDNNQIEELDWISNKLINSQNENDINDLGDTVNIAVMDYKLVDRQRTSSNRGDYVQTLAALSNILRFQDVEYIGNNELNKCLNELKDEIQPSRKISLNNGRIKASAFPLDRDFASGRHYPKNTWLICNGWFMHRNFKGEIDFPFPETINPIFLSFHINDPSVLNSDVATQLKKSEPIGCRDWTTVYRLREMGVSCFFSGCLTTTVGQILPSASTQEPAIALVESRISDTNGVKVDEFSQVGDYVRDFTLTEGIKDARDMLKGYLPYTKIKTSRLHCYLPCRSMGFDVEFSPRNKSDVRFEGLLDLSPEKFLNIRSGIENKLEKIFQAIFEFQSYENIMKIWKEICQKDVIEADEYIKKYMFPESSPQLIPSLVESIEVSKYGTEDSKAVHVAFATDQNLMGYFPTVLQSVLENTSRKLVVHFMYRSLPQDYLEELHKAFPEVSFRMYKMDGVDYGNQVRMLKHTTVSTMDRCLLPEVIKDQNKVVYLDIDILVRGDVSELYDINLDEYFVAGKLSNLKSWSSVVKLVTRGSLFLQPEEAWNIRRKLHHRHKLYETTFNAGVIVMNLQLMREREFSLHAIDLISKCHLNDQDVLNIFGASNVYELKPEWNYVPAQDYCSNPKIIHWAGTVKSWNDMPILWKKEFIDVSKRAPDIASYTWRGKP